MALGRADGMPVAVVANDPVAVVAAVGSTKIVEGSQLNELVTVAVGTRLVTPDSMTVSVAVVEVEVVVGPGRIVVGSGTVLFVTIAVRFGVT
jgi:hypothetical protein